MQSNATFGFGLAATVVAGSSGLALAGFANRAQGPIVSPFDAEVSLRLIDRNAGWDGELSLLLPGEAQPVFLTTNKNADRNTPVCLGEVDAGDQLLFQYEVTRGTLATYRMDNQHGAKQFRHEWMDADTARLYVEDINVTGGDRDFNDAVYELDFVTVPAPGSLALAAGGLGLLAKRRRK